MSDLAAGSANRRILIVDDNESIHDDYRRVLCAEARVADAGVDALETAIFGTPATANAANGQPFEIAHAMQGQDALAMVSHAIARQSPYAVAFVDMRMPPGWDGVETIERLWQVDPGLQVVICSAHSDYQWDHVVQRLGRSDQLLFLRKPFDPAEVYQLALSLTQKWDLAQHHLAQLRAANDSLQKELQERERMQERLRHDAMHDGLTGLPNRALLLDRIGQCLKRAQRGPEDGCAVLFLDLDNLKLVNDSFGHRTGDALLIEVSRRLSREVRACDTIGRPISGIAGRLGGDEFIVLLEDVGDATAAAKIAQRLQDILRDPIALEGREVFVTASIGIAMGSPQHTADVLLREADTAMYRAKIGGKARCVLFDQRMHEAVLERLMIEADLRTACAQGELQVVYQPIVHLETGRHAGFESLMRWNHPVRGRVPPAVFIPIAEESGQIHALGFWILEQVCAQIAQWLMRFPAMANAYVSVNVSRHQLLEPHFVERVSGIIAGAGISPRHLHIEVTENAVMVAGLTDGRVLDALSRLRELGCRILMDDFGTGHSSLSCLHRFPIDVLKIDRAFVDTMGNNRDYAAVVQAIVGLAHNLDVRVIAEGVESTEQTTLLQALDCDFAQGYLFSRPLPAEQATMILLEGGRWARAAA